MKISGLGVCFVLNIHTVISGNSQNHGNIEGRGQVCRETELVIYIYILSAS